ncbi:MAG: hypothetical protein CSA22_06690 [Deltaproteobacteria bacterium]|nr:MAG: hypothetical protein CSA22_06690 [Deltaproteobacteria bacterium]
MRFVRSAGMRAAVVWCLFFAGASNADDAPTALPLNAVYRLALSHAESLRIAALDVDIARENLRKAKSVLIPSLSGFASHSTYMDTDDTLSQPDRYTGWGARLDQRFTLNGRELIAYGMAKDRIREAAFNRDALTATYLYQVSRAYYDIMRARQAVTIQKAEHARLITHRNAVTARVALGDVTKPEIYRADAEVSGAKSAVIRSENDLMLARHALTRLVAVPWPYTVSHPSLKDPVMPEADMDTLIRTAFDNRCELKALAYAVKTVQNQIRIDKSAYWPSLGLSAVYTDFSQSPDAFARAPDGHDDSDSVRVGIELTVPLYQGGLRSAQVRETRARTQQARLAIIEQKKQIRLDVASAFLNLITQVNAFAALKEQVRFAKANYAATVEQFSYGLVDSVAVMDSSTLLATSETELLNAQYTYHTAVIGLDWATGQLLAKVKQAVYPEKESAP